MRDPRNALLVLLSLALIVVCSYVPRAVDARAQEEPASVGRYVFAGSNSGWDRLYLFTLDTQTHELWVSTLGFDAKSKDWIGQRVRVQVVVPTPEGQP